MTAIQNKQMYVFCQHQKRPKKCNWLVILNVRLFWVLVFHSLVIKKSQLCGKLLEETSSTLASSHANKVLDRWWGRIDIWMIDKIDWGEPIYLNCYQAP